MSSSEPKPNSNEVQSVKKRSPMERAVVWGGILILLAVLGFEVMSQNQYGTTLKSLEAAVQTRNAEFVHVGIPASEIHNHVKGNPRRTEESAETLEAREPLLEGQKRVLYQWPSLFKTYILGVSIDQNNVAYFVEGIASLEQDRSHRPFLKLERPQKAVEIFEAETSPATDNAEKPETTEKAN